MTTANAVCITDLHPKQQNIRDEVIEALKQQPPHLPSKYFYDERGAKLFEQICELPEYYPTRSELAILKQYLPQISAAVGEQIWVIEPGSGSGQKTELLLQALDQAQGYLAIDISKEQLKTYLDGLAEQHESLDVRGVCADFTQDIKLDQDIQNRLIYFPGSTIGNFARDDALAFLQRMRRLAGDQGQLLIGVDMKKDRQILEEAYNDSAGITAEFNTNLLRHINYQTGSDFDLLGFEHKAVWNDEIGAIQMLLISQASQIVNLGGQQFKFAEGDQICTEYSHKYEANEFAQLAASAGWEVQQRFADQREWFSVHHFKAA